MMRIPYQFLRSKDRLLNELILIHDIVPLEGKCVEIEHTFLLNEEICSRAQKNRHK